MPVITYTVLFRNRGGFRASKESHCYPHYFFRSPSCELVMLFFFFSYERTSRSAEWKLWLDTAVGKGNRIVYLRRKRAAFGSETRLF